MVGIGELITNLNRPETGWELPERLEGRALRFARTSWIAAAATLTALVAFGFARAYDDPMLVAMPPLTDLFVELGLDFRLMMTIALAIPFVAVAAISIYVFVRRSDDPMALLFTMALWTLYGFSSRSLLALEGIPLLEHAISVFFAFGAVLLALLFGLFPNGRFVPRWSRWLAPAMALSMLWSPDTGAALMTVIGGDTSVTWRSRIVVAGFSLVVMAGLGAQVHRYRNVSSNTERQQAKWVIAPLGLLFVILLTVLIAFAATPDRIGTWVAWVLFAAIPVSVALPVGVANAVLRHRLYDIGRVVSRTVSYGLVVTVLGGVYALGVLGIGSLVSAATPGGEGNSIVVAGSVLAVAALFRPVSSRIHRAVDRRFNRVRYESQLLLEDFAARLQHGTSLDQLRSDLEQTVEDAFQPASLAVWMLYENR